MKLEETDKFGIYIFLINIMIVLFMLTSKDITYAFYIVTIISNIVAIILNSIILKASKKRLVNILSLILNIIVFIGIFIYTLIKYDLI